MDFIYSILSFIVAIGVLVAVHEFGHFWVARRLGVKVLRFSIGFGRPLWRYQSHPDATEYVVAAFPLGGYVKMVDEREGEVTERDLPHAFNRKPLGVRFAVVLAGPAFNFAFAVLAFWLMFMIGVSGLKSVIGEVTPGSPAARAGMQAGQQIVAVGDRETRTWEAVVQGILGSALDREGVELTVRSTEAGSRRVDIGLEGVVLDDLTRGRFFDVVGVEPLRPAVPAVLGQLEAGAPAERAGLAPGDLVVAADGEPIEDWRAWVQYVRGHPDESIRVEVERDGTRMELRLRPESASGQDGTIGRIGAAVQAPVAAGEEYYVTERHSAGASAGRALAKTWEISTLTLRMFWKMLTLEVSVENLSGPISIAQYAGFSAQIGVSRFFEFLAIVSISLGILNLLPIPILDGGHLMYYLIEFFKGRPVSEETQIVGQRLGIAMLMGLMGLAFYNDLARIFG